MKRDRASELRAIADGRLMLNVRNGVTVSRSMLAMIADEIDALRAAPLTPAEAGGLVERLRDRAESYRMGGPSSEHTAAILDEAATALEAQAAELAAKEEARAEQWRQRREAGGSRDVARAACDTMRIERDDARAALAEARKALEPFARNVELIHPGAQDHDRLCDYGSQFNGTPTVGQARAARRALTGG